MADPFAGDLFASAPAPDRGVDHRAFVRTLPCLRCFVQFRLTSAPPSQAHRVTFAGADAPERDPAQWVIPLCDHHLNKGSTPQTEALLWEKLGVDLAALCIALFADSGDRARARAAFIVQANRARCSQPDAPFKLLDPASAEAKKVQAQFQKEASIRV